MFARLFRQGTALKAPARRAVSTGGDGGKTIGGARIFGRVASLLAVSSLGAYTYQNEHIQRTSYLATKLAPVVLSYYYIKLKTSAFGLSREEEREMMKDFHNDWYALPLEIILHLRGFYVKAGQVVSSNPNILPEQYIKSLRVLQKDVPPLPSSEIRKIIEKEMGIDDVDEVFESFSEKPIGAASIGQVHTGTLKDTGKEVVVKVQYPEVERFFSVDFRTTLFILGFINENMVEIVKGIQDNFMKEFDYNREADNLKLMEDHIEAKAGMFDNVVFPKVKRELCTRKVLVMEKIEGETITEMGERLLEDVVRVGGFKNKTEFRDRVRKSLRNPDKQQEFIESYGKLSGALEKAVGFSRVLLSLRNSIYGLCGGAYNSTRILPYFFGKAEPKMFFVPPNGPSLMRLLWDVHGYQIFNIGAFNSDPHSGNILIDSSNGAVGLIDYGQVAFLEEEWRANFARYIIAIDDENKAEVHRLWGALGNKFLWKVTGEINPVDETFACALCHFGGPPGIMKGIKMLKFNSIKDIGSSLNDKIKIIDCRPEYGMLQRCCFCLLGVAQQVGVFGQGTVPCKMLRPAAERYLTSIGEMVKG
ncbi:hypothetical protein TrST_g14123 [Triparma strigata]|uniref:ABC1 atypical kinase-like domain-containing protein n=1 Tax=Triparma strigata TaxID=1606541 RepID=A0A9W7AIA5_9STRA|nr:hypothetical protein TrST_g14123 [Triparma strigata]